jgi:hypothetical protein
MSDLTISKGDYGYELTFPITDNDGTPVNITDYTAIKLKAWRRGMASNPKISGTCSKVVPYTSGICTYLVASSDFDKPENLIFELELTKTGVVESTRRYTVTVEDSPS